MGFWMRWGSWRGKRGLLKGVIFGNKSGILRGCDVHQGTASKYAYHGKKGRSGSWQFAKNLELGNKTN
jgi:hypothetical protein